VQCINCAACAQFAPSVFVRSPQDSAHVVHHQPATPGEIVEARAALSACPVAAIRTETNAQRSHRGREEMERFTPSEEELAKQLAINFKFNGRPPPFPLRVSATIDGIYFVGHHCEKTFGAIPYLLETEEYGWILVDTPKYSKSAVQAIEQLTGPSGPSYMLLTHVDDTTGHNDWKQHYPHLKRIFHAGDLGRHNWLGDETLGEVEILLQKRSSNEQLQFFDIQGNFLENPTSQEGASSVPEIVLVHTPGHSPGSICLWRPPTKNLPGLVCTGDTYAFTTRGGGRMTSFPRYGNDRTQQSQILPLLAELDWSLVAPGHGHIRDYSVSTPQTTKDQRLADMEPAIAELTEWPAVRR
jgi:glyoxylase-like metal-dependent hydrolase (beta-lactamase superfamily II)/ferredoxin